MSGPGNETPTTPPKAPSATPPKAPASRARATRGRRLDLAGHGRGEQRREHPAPAPGRRRAVGAGRLQRSIVVIVYLLFQFILDYPVVSDFTVVMAVLTILAIWVHRWGHYDFGNGYRIVIGALGLSLALFAIINFLAWVRVGGDSAGFLHLIGRIIYWVSGIAAGYGAWLVFRLRED